MTISKKQLIALVAADTGETKNKTEFMLNSVLSNIEAELRLGGDVQIFGFGKFSKKQTPARTGRNPSTGAALAIAAKSKPVFKPASDFVAKFN